MVRVFILVLSLCVAEVQANCDDVSSTPNFNRSYSEGWGITLSNTRYQSSSVLQAENVNRLKLKWAYGLHNTTPRAYPLVTGDTIFNWRQRPWRCGLSARYRVPTVALCP